MKAGQILYPVFLVLCVFVIAVCLRQASANQLVQSDIEIGSYDGEKTENTAERVKKDGGMAQERNSEVGKLETNLQKLNWTLNSEIKWGKLNGALASAAFHIGAARNLALKHKIEVTLDPKKYGDGQVKTTLGLALKAVIKKLKKLYSKIMSQSKSINDTSSKNTLAQIIRDIENGSKNDFVENYQKLIILVDNDFLALEKMPDNFLDVQLMIREVIGAVPTSSAKEEIVDHLKRFSVDLDTSAQTWFHLVQMFQRLKISNKIGFLIAKKLLDNFDKGSDPKAANYLRKEALVKLNLYLMRITIESKFVAGRSMGATAYHKIRSKNMIIAMIKNAENSGVKTDQLEKRCEEAKAAVDSFEESILKKFDILIPNLLKQMDTFGNSILNN